MFLMQMLLIFHKLKYFTGFKKGAETGMPELSLGSLLWQ